MGTAHFWVLSHCTYSQLSPGILVEELIHGPADDHPEPTHGSKVWELSLPPPAASAAPRAAATSAAAASAAVASAALAAPLSAAAKPPPSPPPPPPPPPPPSPPPPLAEDLKCFVFGGVTRVVLHVGGRLEGHKTDSVFDAATGRLLDVTVKGSRRETNPAHTVFARRPGLLEELRRRCDGAASALGLDFVRVDFLLADNAGAGSGGGSGGGDGGEGGGGGGGGGGGSGSEVGSSGGGGGGGGGGGWRLLLGELTLYPGGGAFVWEPPAFDDYLGSFVGGSSCEPAPYHFVWQRLG